MSAGSNPSQQISTAAEGFAHPGTMGVTGGNADEQQHHVSDAAASMPAHGGQFPTADSTLAGCGEQAYLTGSAGDGGNELIDPSLLLLE